MRACPLVRRGTRHTVSPIFIASLLVQQLEDSSKFGIEESIRHSVWRNVQSGLLTCYKNQVELDLGSDAANTFEKLLTSTWLSEDKLNTFKDTLKDPMRKVGATILDMVMDDALARFQFGTISASRNARRWTIQDSLTHLTDTSHRLYEEMVDQVNQALASIDPRIVPYITLYTHQDRCLRRKSFVA